MHKEKESSKDRNQGSQSMLVYFSPFYKSKESKEPERKKTPVVPRLNLSTLKETDESIHLKEIKPPLIMYHK